MCKSNLYDSQWSRKKNNLDLREESEQNRKLNIIKLLPIFPCIVGGGSCQLAIERKKTYKTIFPTIFRRKVKNNFKVKLAEHRFLNTLDATFSLNWGEN